MMASLSISGSLKLGLSATLMLSACVNAQTLHFDSDWWRHTAHDEEREGFVLGYFDCPKAPKTVSGISTNDTIAYVDKHLGFSRDASVPSVLDQAKLGMEARPILKGGEEYPEKHGWLDGAWWGDAKHGDLEDQRGYVEGYLQCEYGQATTSQTQAYVNALNLHFANPSNEHHKIANVLQPIIDSEKKRS
jgi:hypothetical protein